AVRYTDPRDITAHHPPSESDNIHTSRGPPPLSRPSEHCLFVLFGLATQVCRVRIVHLGRHRSNSLRTTIELRQHHRFASAAALRDAEPLFYSPAAPASIRADDRSPTEPRRTHAPLS